MSEQVLELSQPPADLLALSKAEIDLQIATAKTYPRSLKDFQAGALEMVCYSQETAEKMYYKLPRKTNEGKIKIIEGPSVRFAEIIGQNWRNCRIAARVVGADDRHVVSQGVFHDLETNVAVSFEIKRRITGKDGRRYNDDMITMTGAAAAGIAFRNAVLKGVPKMFWNSLYEKALEVAKPNDTEIASRRKAALETFADVGVPEAAVLEVLGVKSVAKIGADELVTLRGIWNAIKEGSTTPAEAFELGPKPLKPTTEAPDLTGVLQESIEDVAARKKRVAAKNKPVEKGPQPVQAAIPPAPKINDPLIDDKQQSKLLNAAFQSGWKRVPEDVNAMLTKQFKVKSFRELRNSQFGEALTIIESGTERRPK